MQEMRPEGRISYLAFSLLVGLIRFGEFAMIFGAKECSIFLFLDYRVVGSDFADDPADELL